MKYGNLVDGETQYMSKMKINLFGQTFQHDVGSTNNQPPTYIEWEYNVFNNPITFYVDYAITKGTTDNNDCTKYGWMLESKFIVPGLLEWCKQNHQLIKKTYRHIFTYHKELILLDCDLFKFCPAMGSWIKNPEIKNKTKLVSMISSNKITTAGQMDRLKYVQKFKNNLDLYGKGFNPIDCKERGLEDYMFSVAIENGVCSSYFTEKILDCFALGVVPVYLGAPDIGDFFDKDGIIQLTEDFDLSLLTPELYELKHEAIKNNFNIMQMYKVPEDFIYNNYIKT